MKYLCLLIALFSLASADISAQDPVSVGFALNEFENKAQNVLNDANFAFNDVVNNAAVNVLNSIQQFKDAYGDILNQTSDALTQQQQQAYRISPGLPATQVPSYPLC